MEFEITSESFGILPLSMEYFSKPEDIIIHNCDDSGIDTLWLIVPNNDDKKTILSKTILSGRAAELIIVANGNLEVNGACFSGFSKVLITDHQVTIDPHTNFPAIEDKQSSALVTINEINAAELWLWGTKFHLNSGIITDLLKIVGKSTNQIELFGSEERILQIGNLEVEAPEATLLVKHTMFIGSKVNGNTNIFKGRFLSFGEHFQNWNLKAKLLDVVSITESSSLGLAEVKVKKFHFDGDEVILRSLGCPHGEYFIAPGVSINFYLKLDDYYTGLSLTISSPSADRNIIFPSCKQVVFDKITIISKATVYFNAKEIISRLIEVVDTPLLMLTKVSTEKFSYVGNGKVTIDQITAKEFLYEGNNIIHLGKDTSVAKEYVNIDYAEIRGGGDLYLHGSSYIGHLRINLDIDSHSLNKTIGLSKDDGRGLYISSKGLVKIDSILGKVNKIMLKGPIEIGEAYFHSFRDDDFIFTAENPVKFLKLVLGGIEIVEDATGIKIKPLDIKVRASRTGGTAIIAAVNIKSELLLAATSTNMLSVWGDFSTGPSGDILFRSLTDLNIKAAVSAGRYLITDAVYGAVRTADSELHAKAIVQYGGAGGAFIAATNINAEQYLVTSISGDTVLTEVNAQARNIIILSEKGRVVLDKLVSTSDIMSIGGRSQVFSDSHILTSSMLVKALEQTILIKTNIETDKTPYVIVTDRIEADAARLVAIDSHNILLAIIFPNANTSTSIDLTSLTYDKINSVHLSKEEIESKYALPRNIYFDTATATILGSKITGAEKVVLKCKESIEVLPLIVYNRIMSTGGFAPKKVENVISEITAGLISIEAKDTITIISSILKATYGRVDADIINVINADNIYTNQKRMDVLKKWGISTSEDRSEDFIIGEAVSEAFKFSHTTEVRCRAGIDLLAPFNSANLIYTKREGDVVISDSVSFKYDSLHLNVPNGKLLIVSKDLNRIYQSRGIDAAYDARTVVGGKNIYIEADCVEVSASVFKLTGDLKIVAQNGVHILPVAVHQRLAYHVGSKTFIDEEVVRQVISEIQAGYLEVSAKDLRAVSAFIKAQNVSFDVDHLLLGAEKEIFEKNVYFRGAKKWHGGRNSWHDHTKDETVVPTIIETAVFSGKVTHETTIEAANILASKEVELASGGGINLLAKYDIHVKDFVSKKSYFFRCHGGKLTVASSKTIQEHFYGESPVPTIYYSGGSFFCFSEGKIYSMGAKIIAGNTIYLEGQQGIKLDTAPYKTEHFVTISEKGYRSGYTLNTSETSVGSELFKETTKEHLTAIRHEASLIRAGSNLILNAGKSDLELRSSHLEFEHGAITAGNVIATTAHEEVIYTVESESTTIGVKAGVKTDKLASLLKSAENFGRAGQRIYENENGPHPLDILDGVLNGYALIKHSKPIREMIAHPSDIKEIASGSISAGVWAEGGYHRQAATTHTRTAIDNVIIGGDLEIKAIDAIDLTGIKCNLKALDIDAKTFNVTASHDTREQVVEREGFSITVPLMTVGSDIPGVSTSFKASASTSTTSEMHFHSDNSIKIEGKLSLKLSGDGKIKGVQVQAAVVDVKAKNLLVESLQSTISHRLEGMSMDISLSKVSSGFSITPEGGEREARWTESLGQLIGTQAVNIVLAEALELTGGLIANAEIDKVTGNLTDKGNMDIEAASIIAKKLHDYDNGSSYAIGFGIAKSSNGSSASGQGGKSNIELSDIELKYELSNQQRDISSVLGAGKIKASDIIGELTRDVALGQVGETSGDHGKVDATIPLRDIIDTVKARIKEISERAEEKAVVIEVYTEDKTLPPPMAGAGGPSEDVESEERKPVRAKVKAKKVKAAEIEEVQTLLLVTANKPEISDEEKNGLKQLNEDLDNIEEIARIYNNEDAGDEESLGDKIISGLNELLGVPNAKASGVGAAVSSDTVKVVAATFNALALKYGPRVARFVVTRAMSIVIPGVGTALLAKDLYDLGNATYDIMLQKGIINGPAAEFGIDEDDEGVFEKRRHDKAKSKAVVSKFKDSAAAGMPGPDDLEPDDDKEDDSFDPSKKENHDKVRRTDQYGKLYRDAKDSRIWYSKERSGDRAHGGEHWKKFKEQGDTLYHEADIDIMGRVINKHKSNVGTVIKLKDTIGIK